MTDANPPSIPSQPAAKALQRLEHAADRLDFYGRIDSVSTTLLDCIEQVRAGTMRPSQGNAVALLCSTLIKALEVARGNTPAVSITAQLNREEIQEILHGRDPFRPTVTAHAEPASKPGDLGETDHRTLGNGPHTDGPEG